MKKALRAKVDDFDILPPPPPPPAKSDFTVPLVVLVIIAAFFLGMLTTKVQYLEKGVQPSTPAQVAGAGTAQPNQPAVGAKVDVEVGNLPVQGNKDAKVTIVEFADFQCPFCEKWFTDITPSLKKDYIDTGKVKFAYRHYAFLGQESQWAAQASECANEQGKFWEFHDYLFNNQQGENQGAFAKDKLKGFAQTLGLNAGQFDSCLDSEKYAKQVADDLSAGQKAGVNGTPATFINGRMVSGAQPYTSFKTMIEEELKK